MKTVSLLLRILTVASAVWASIGVSLRAQAPAAAKNDKVYVPYRLTRGDVVTVAVMGEPDLTSGRRRIEATGTVNLPLILDIRLVGLTVAEAQETIAKAYRTERFLRNPQVTVTIDEYQPRSVRISGKVNTQGLIHIPPDTEFTLLDAIFRANGLAETANGKNVRITRMMPDGSQKVFILDVESAIKARDKNNNEDAKFVLEPDDTIFVPERII